MLKYKRRGAREQEHGVFYGNRNKRNRGYAVGGRQTSQRAELTAFLRCIENDKRKLVIRTDSKYVQLGITLWMQNWKKRAWYDKPLQAKFIDNVDLWKRVDKQLKQREAPVKVEWVKGHGLPHHMRLGLTTELDIWANDGADLVAGAAALEVGGGSEEDYIECPDIKALG